MARACFPSLQTTAQAAQQAKMSASKRRSSVGFALSPTKRRSTFGGPSSDTPHSRRHSIMDSVGSDNVFMDVPAVRLVCCVCVWQYLQNEELY